MAKKPRRKRRVRVTGWHESDKAVGGRARYRSSYELCYFRMLDTDATVISYHSEPFKIQYKYGGLNRVYVPDVLVVTDGGGSFLVEVKPCRMVSWARNLAKFRAARCHCAGRGMSFRLITERELVGLARSRRRRR